MIRYNCRGPRLLGRPQRAGCGQSLNALIDALPEDGEDHIVTCPKCGNETVVCRTAPAS